MNLILFTTWKFNHFVFLENQSKTLYVSDPDEAYVYVYILHPEMISYWTNK